MKKGFSVVLAMGLAAALAIPAGAQEAEPTTVPETVQIEDPLDDANALNEQGFRADAGFQGDHGTPVDAGSVSDLVKVWFTHDAETISVHFNTQAAPPASTSTFFEVFANPGGDWTLGCLRFGVLIPGAYQGQATTYQGPPLAKLIDRCNDEGTNFYNNGVEGEIVIEAGPDVPQQYMGAPGPSGILTATFPRSYSPLLADGLSIVTPFATTKVAVGAEAAGFTSPITMDNTADGTDYVITVEEKPTTKPPVKKGCSKGSPKAKKNGCKK